MIYSRYFIHVGKRDTQSTKLAIAPSYHYVCDKSIATLFITTTAMGNAIFLSPRNRTSNFFKYNNHHDVFYVWLDTITTTTTVPYRIVVLLLSSTLVYISLQSDPSSSTQSYFIIKLFYEAIGTFFFDSLPTRLPTEFLATFYVWFEFDPSSAMMRLILELELLLFCAFTMIYASADQIVQDYVKEGKRGMDHFRETFCPECMDICHHPNLSADIPSSRSFATNIVRSTHAYAFFLQIDFDLAAEKWLRKHS